MELAADNWDVGTDVDRRWTDVAGVAAAEESVHSADKDSSAFDPVEPYGFGCKLVGWDCGANQNAGSGQTVELEAIGVFRCAAH